MTGNQAYLSSSIHVIHDVSVCMFVKNRDFLIILEIIIIIIINDMHIIAFVLYPYYFKKVTRRGWDTFKKGGCLIYGGWTLI